MFRLSHEDLQRRRFTKPIQLMEEMFKTLSFNELVEPGVKGEMTTAFSDVFERYAPIVNPKGWGKQIYAFDSHLLIDYMCCTWADLYATFTISREEVLRDKALLDQEVKKLKNCEEGLFKKLTGELDVCHQKLREIQVAISEIGKTIASLEQHITDLSIKHSNVANRHKSHTGHTLALSTASQYPTNLSIL